MGSNKQRRSVRAGFVILVACALIGGFAGPVAAQDVCEGASCDDLPTSICDAGGFKVTQTGYVAASSANSGTATYTYQVCSPPSGVCTDGNGTGIREGEACLHNSFCQAKGQETDPESYCTRECAVDTFRGLSHFDVDFPSLGDTCLSETNFVGGTCACTPGSTTGCQVDPLVVLGDGSCPNDGTVAKCDNTTLAPGDCIEMTLQIAGETNELGLGAAIVVSKESTDCNESCIAGPSCERCDDVVEGDECLTRTIGFWGTHPWITNDYDPVTVCGESVGCSGPSDGKSDPSCLAGSCDSIMEALGSVGGESPKNAAYIAMLKQLAAAKLNLAATAGTTTGSCGDFLYGDKTIEAWISTCESLCGENQATISSSGCIEALNAFNNSEDVLEGATPAPFDRPPVDDFGNVSGADGSAFTAAQGNSTPPGKWVIGKKIGSNDCTQ
jgi:hypothetical protein